MNKHLLYRIVATFLILMLVLALLPGSPARAGTDTFTSSGTWIAPGGVTSVTVQAWGGGGGGGRSAAGNNKGGGGAGGQFATSVITVTPLASYTVVVGAAGAGGSLFSPNGGAGGNTSFNATSVVARGGAGGVSDGAGGAGSTTGGVGTTVNRGGNGSAGGASATGGAGGGGAGSTGNGGDASGNTAGIATSTGGGSGGAGRTTVGNGNTGSNYGGGGGGGYTTSFSLTNTGGAGAGGQVILTYDVGPVLTSPTVTAILDNQATIGATISSAGNGAITDRGFCAGTGPLPSYCVSIGGTALGAISIVWNPLTPSTRFYYRGYATNSIPLTRYSLDGSFYTRPSVQASAYFPTGFGGTFGTLNWTRGNGDGVIVLMKAGSAVDSDPVDGTYTGYTANSAFGSGTQLGTGNFVVYKGTGTSVNLTGLIGGTTYYLAIYEFAGTTDTSGNDLGTSYMSSPLTSNVTTNTDAPALAAPSVSAISNNTATMADTIIANGGAAVTERGFCAGISPAPIYCVPEGGTALGLYSYVWNPLTPATHFYYRGYAKNSALFTGYSADGDFYTKPDVQASAVNFTAVLSTSMTVNWTNPGPNAIVLMKASLAVDAAPVDFTPYSANAAFASGNQLGSGNYVIYSGSGNSVNVTGLTLGTTYYVAVYTYAGSGSSSNFDTTAPATGSQATLPVFVNSGSFTWTAPLHVTSVTVEAWGGGGKGANLTAAGGGGGGGGGAYSRKTNVPVWPGSTYTAVVGGGSSSDATPGGDSYFINQATVLAKGGSSAAAGSATGAAGGLDSAGIGDTTHSGGNGADGASGGGGGGGSSAGTSLAGFVGSGSTGGLAPVGGGDGGNGATGAPGNGLPGSFPGGAGGGAYLSSAGAFAGGNGADGKVVITFVLTTDTSLAVACTPTSIEERYWTACTATVTQNTPISNAAHITGTVGWTISSADSGTFTSTRPTTPSPTISSICTLSGNNTSASCKIYYTANAIGTGAHVLTATYNGDGNYGRSTANTTETVVTDVAPTIPANGISILLNSGYQELDENASVPSAVTLTTNYHQPVLQMKVAFNKDVLNLPSSDPNYAGSVINPANYRFLFVQSNFAVRTTSCVSAINSFDHVLPIASVSYSNGAGGLGPYVATLTFGPYPGTDVGYGNDQRFRLFVCGTTSIADLDGKILAGDATTQGTDFIRNFIVVGPNFPSTGPTKIPKTGFAPNRVTTLPMQPAAKAYDALGPVWLYIPKLGVESNIIGVPELNGDWDVSWLNNDIGWLQGTAFPSLSGNAVLTGHYFNSYGAAGPFRYLGQLAVGDTIIVRAYQVNYIYKVRSLQQVDPGDIAAMMKHQDTPWLTLVTCVDYLANNDFKYRLIVNAEFVGKQ